jgi:hypothetical protein
LHFLVNDGAETAAQILHGVRDVARVALKTVAQPFLTVFLSGLGKIQKWRRQESPCHTRQVAPPGKGDPDGVPVV